MPPLPPRTLPRSHRPPPSPRAPPAQFVPEVVERQSVAAKSLCMWVRAMEVYGRIAKEVAPKRAKLQAAMKTLTQKQEQLAKAQAKVKEISDKVLALREKYTENVNNKDKLKKESEVRRRAGRKGGEREGKAASVSVREGNAGSVAVREGRLGAPRSCIQSLTGSGIGRSGSGRVRWQIRSGWARWAGRMASQRG